MDSIERCDEATESLRSPCMSLPTGYGTTQPYLPQAVFTPFGHNSGSVSINTSVTRA